MSDGQIRAELRTHYLRIGEDAAVVFAEDENHPIKDLAAFKDFLLKNVWRRNSSDPAFRPRFERLQQQVVDEVGPDLFGYVSDGPPTISKFHDTTPTRGNVAQAADPVQLFDGDFRYSTVDFQLNGAGIDLVFARTYSQLTNYRGPLGEKWDHSYNLWIRVDTGGATLHRSTGALAEETFTRHETHAYWVPPPGVHGVVTEGNDSLIFSRSDRSSITYEQQPGMSELVYLATKIVDRFGNALTLEYTDGLLSRMFVNEPSRRLEFRYNDQFLTAIRDYTGRTWQYHFGSEADLVGMTLPATRAQPRGATTEYGYMSVATAAPDMAHHLTSILDPDGRIRLENEYGTDRGLLNYRRLVAQRQGSGQVDMDYSDVVEDFALPYAEHELPRHQTIVTERDGQITRHLFNAYGNLLMHEEVARIDGLPRLLTTHYRYNRDGNLTAVMSPLGTLTQGLWGRDLYDRRFPVQEGTRPEQDNNLTPTARLTFGNLLTVVKRTKGLDLGQLGQIAGLWSSEVFPDIFGAGGDDVIQKFTYEPEAGQVLTASDPRVTTSPDPDAEEDNEYNRRMTRYTYANGPISGRLEFVDLPTPTLPDGNPGQPVRTHFSGYDDHGRVVETIAPNGLHTVHEYAPDDAGIKAGFLTSFFVDPGGLGLRHSLEPDDLGRTVKLARPSAESAGDGRYVSSVVYDERSQVLETVSTPPLSIRTVNSFDSAGNLLLSEQELADADGTRTGSLLTASRYDNEGHIVYQRIGDPTGTDSKTQRMRFDGAGRPAIVLSAVGRIRKFRYNERGLVSAVIDDFAGVHAVTRRIYDGDGRLQLLTDPRGYVSRYTYDALGRNIQVEDPLGNRSVRHFDKLGNPVVECLYEKQDDDAFVLAQRRAFEYDELGLLISAAANRFPPQAPIQEAEVLSSYRNAGPGRDLKLRLFRDNLGNIVKEVDQDDREFPVQVDVLGRVAARSDPLGNEVRLKYDKEGNVVRVDRKEVTVDPASGAAVGEQWFAESFSFDELNRLDSHRTTTGTSHVEYNSRGLPVHLIDRMGNETEHDYDVFGRRKEMRRLLEIPGFPVTAIRTSYSYNLDDQLIQCTDHLGHATLFSYDTAGRLRVTTLADQTHDEYTYDSVGNATSYRDRNGLCRDLIWDALNRNTGVILDVATLPDELIPEGAAHTRFQYDALDRVVLATNDFAEIQIAYDSLAPERESVSFTPASGLGGNHQYVLLRETSDTGAVSSLTYPSGRSVRFHRDPLDRVVAVEQTSRGQGYPGGQGTPDQFIIATIDYSGLRPARISRSNGVTTAYRYDFGGRAIDIEHVSAVGRSLHQQQLYDAAGRVCQRLEEGQVGQGQAKRFTYDSLSRLRSVHELAIPGLPDVSTLAAPSLPLADPVPDRQHEIDALLTAIGPFASTYTYDETDNRRTANTATGAHLYMPNDLNQYAEVDGNAVAYDANGNRKSYKNRTYGYDYRNQLVTLREQNQIQLELLRDAFGRICVERSDAGIRALFYEGRSIIEEHDATGPRLSILNMDCDNPCLMSTGAGMEWFPLHDLSRSVRILFRGREVSSNYEYDDFGQLLAPPAPMDNNIFYFAGMRFVGASNNYECGYRAYDPVDGRFLQRDPQGLIDGSNLYTFVRNDPLSLIDPEGTDSQQSHPSIGAKVGAELAYRNPEGFTLALDDSVGSETLRDYRRRINNPTDRAVGIRSRLPGQKTSTQDIRRRPDVVKLKNDFKASMGGDYRPDVHDIGHRVDLQHIIRPRPGQYAPGADTVLELGKGHILQQKGPNRSLGSLNQKAKARQIRSGAPLDTSAGGVALERDVNKLWNRPGYRTTWRLFGYYNLVGGTFDSLTSIGDALSEGDYASAGVGTSAYLGGAFEIGGIVARSSVLLNVGSKLGAPAAVVSSAVIGARIGTNLYEHYVNHDMFLDAGSWMEEKTGSRIAGASFAAYIAVTDAAAKAPEAAYDYVVDNVTLDPEDIDWDRTLRPWRW
ncbi:RHS repeat-associated core domain-containing protein [Arthrobacter sp. NPDC093128]|uniref:RHS repeat domain-containing protein n=1 Tax=Arthrobacter sp. NPDC093128 TaxID=3154979 RepID=UPI003419291D